MSAEHGSAHQISVSDLAEQVCRCHACLLASDSLQPTVHNNCTSSYNML